MSKKPNTKHADKHHDEPQAPTPIAQAPAPASTSTPHHNIHELLRSALAYVDHVGQVEHKAAQLAHHIRQALEHHDKH